MEAAPCSDPDGRHYNKVSAISVQDCRCTGDPSRWFVSEALLNQSIALRGLHVTLLLHLGLLVHFFKIYTTFIILVFLYIYTGSIHYTWYLVH